MCAKKSVDSINVAVIGAGYWGKKVISEYEQLAAEDPDITLAEVCDLPQDYRDVLSVSDINAIHICTPNETHYQICKDALLAGKNVLVEKPMTLDSKQAFELVELARTNNLLLQVGYIFRHNNVIKKVRALVDQQCFGEIFYMKLRWTTQTNPPRGRDILFDLAPHPIDILNYLLDEWPSAITCKANAYKGEHEDMAYIIAEFNDNIMGHIELSWLQPEKTRELDIIGSERCGVIDCMNQTIELDGEPQMVEKNNTIGAELSSFLDCIRSGDSSASEIGAKNVEMIEYAIESRNEGMTIQC